MSDKDKALGQFKLQLNGVFEPFNLYGLNILIPEAKEAVVDLALQLHDRLNGVDRPIVYKKRKGR